MDLNNYINKTLLDIREKKKEIEKDYEGSLYTPDEDLEYMTLCYKEAVEVAKMIQNEFIYCRGLWKQSK